MKWLLNLFRGRSLGEALNETKKIKLCGVIFRIKKINVLDYLDGSRVMQKAYETYEQSRKSSKDSMPEGLSKKVKDHFRDVFLAGVVEPKLARKNSPASEDVWVDELFVDMELCNALYAAIYDFTYDKKKLFSTQRKQK